MPVARRIIPCLDVKDGRVVKGVRFQSLRDAGDPVAAAIAYDRGGADEVTFLDITASHEARAILLDIVRRTADQIFVPLTVGGGVRTRADVDSLLRAGADKVAINTSAVATPELIDEVSRAYGAQVLVVAIDARRRGNASTEWDVVTHGGRRETGREAIAWAREAADRGAGEILLTSMDRDGTGDGYDLDLLRAVGAAVPIPVIASGGAGTLEHIAEALRSPRRGGGGASAALAATIFHDGHFTLAEVKQYLADTGVPVRPTTAEA